MIKNKTKSHIVNKWFNTILQDRFTDDVKNLYDINEMILCHTNDEKDLCTDIFKGVFGDIDKFYILFAIENQT